MKLKVAFSIFKYSSDYTSIRAHRLTKYNGVTAGFRFLFKAVVHEHSFLVATGLLVGGVLFFSFLLIVFETGSQVN